MGRFSTAVDPAWLHHEDRPTDAALALQWLGTAGFRVVYRRDATGPVDPGGDPRGAGCADHHVWLDPHLSRHSLRELAMGPLSPKLDRIAADVDRADAIVVGHSHFDHAIDAPAIARQHGANLYGSSSTIAIGRGYGVAESQLHVLAPGVTVHDGPCAITAYRSQHSRFAFGRVPAPGHVTAPLAWPAPVGAFKVGDVLALHLGGGPLTIAHLGSADLIEAELTGVQADVVLACTVGRYATERFTHRVIDALKPKLVIPCHWDQFWRPIDAPARQIPTNDLGAFLDEVRSHPSKPELRVLPMRGWLTLA